MAFSNKCQINEIIKNNGKINPFCKDEIFAQAKKEIDAENEVDAEKKRDAEKAILDEKWVIVENELSPDPLGETIMPED